MRAATYGFHCATMLSFSQWFCVFIRYSEYTRSILLYCFELILYFRMVEALNACTVCEIFSIYPQYNQPPNEQTNERTNDRPCNTREKATYTLNCRCIEMVSQRIPQPLCFFRRQYSLLNAHAHKYTGNVWEAWHSGILHIICE